MCAYQFEFYFEKQFFSIMGMNEDQNSLSIN